MDKNINYFTRELSKFKEFEILKFSKKHNLKTGYFYGFKLSEGFLKKYKKDDFVIKCKKLNINIQNELYKPVYATKEFGWKNSPIKVNYKNVKCKNADYILKNKVLWLSFIYFLGNKKSLDEILKSFKLVFKHLDI